MKLWVFEKWSDHSDYRSSWDEDYDEIFCHRENAEKALADIMYKKLEQTEKQQNELSPETLRRRAKWDTLTGAGIDPVEFGLPKTRPGSKPRFDWDNPQHTTFTDEELGYRLGHIFTDDAWAATSQVQWGIRREFDEAILGPFTGEYAKTVYEKETADPEGIEVTVMNRIASYSAWTNKKPDGSAWHHDPSATIGTAT